MNGLREGRIKAVLFDLGGTLEEVRCDEQLQRGALAGFRRILDHHGLNPAEWDDRKLLARLGQGMREYKAWRERSEIELFGRNFSAWLPRVSNICIELHGPDCREAFLSALAGYEYTLESSLELTICRNLRRSGA